MSEFYYDKVVKYWISAACESPLHIGSADGSKGEILVHPADHRPFIQASSLAGVFRDYYRNTYGEGHWLHSHTFGSAQKRKPSALRLTDGSFAKADIELRPRLKIDRDSGTCQAEKTAGSRISSGQKFEEEYVAQGAKFSFAAYLKEMVSESEEEKAKLEEAFETCLSAWAAGEICLGGRKGSGSGRISLKQVSKRSFDLRKPEDREAWQKEEDALTENEAEDIKEAILEKASSSRVAYQITATCVTDGELLVKGIAGDVGGEDLNGENIKNAAGKDIIPGTSWKGVLRSRAESIAEYLDLDGFAQEMFGCKSQKGGKGRSGQVWVEDSVVEDLVVKKTGKGNQPVRTRIAIDKFTGGVRYGAMVRDKPVSGELTLSLTIRKNPEADSQCAMLLFILRDLDAGLISVGGTGAAGRGYLRIKEIKISGEQQAVITQKDMKKRMISIEDASGLIRKCMEALKSKKEARA